MKEILEVKELYDIDVVHDPELDKYNGQNLFPKKLAEAQESIAKYGLPKEWEEERQKWKEEKAFWVKGQFSQADLETLTFLLREHNMTQVSNLRHVYKLDIKGVCSVGGTLAISSKPA